MKGNSLRRLPLFRFAFRSSPTTGHTTPSIESHAAPILGLSPPASPPPLRPPILQTEAIPEPLQSQPGPSENLPIRQVADDGVSIDDTVSFDPENTGIPPLDALLKLRNSPDLPEGAAKVLAAMYGMRDEYLAQKRRPEQAIQVIKHVTLQREMWEAELEKAEEDYGQAVKSMGIVIAILRKRGLPIVMPPASVSSVEQSFVEEESD
ncbi:hypothetical protein EW146_g9228 [Bondarzewia mesenterica]|uniref:Uncharacterized protein n=1 Tax=Bondarzewia mesenterica TaxID=1095465 RepID=A0A4S4L8G1_9AGAM|nr:hypothetical protein EW146_g9228 [Bondarzewia mesenterica]